MTQSNLISPDKHHTGVRTVTEEKLMVAVRVRPLRTDEGPRIIHVVSDQILVLEEEADNKRDVLRQRRLNDKNYIYDRVFGEESTQEEVYDTVCAPLVGDTLQGFAGAVFAYGATGAGKTHTMTGLMTRALNHLFTSIAESEEPSAYELNTHLYQGYVDYSTFDGKTQGLMAASLLLPPTHQAIWSFVENVLIEVHLSKDKEKGH